MTDLHNDRVHFPPTKQRELINIVLTSKRWSVSQLAQFLKISTRTVSDWRREKYHMTYGSLKRMCQSAKIKIPKNLDIRSAYSHTSAAGKRGSKAVQKKYGQIFPCDPGYRKQQWEKWWHTHGKENPPPQSRPLPIHTPRPSGDLAEFVGIMIGDGGITKRQITITLNRTDDAEYAVFVAALCEKLFKVKPRLYHRPKNNVVNVVISRSALVKFCQSIGLVCGDKIRQGVDIPEWVNKNQTYLTRCLRGLFDTDGGLFWEKHTYKETQYRYPRLAYVSASPPLIKSLHKHLTARGYHPKIRSHKRVQLEKKVEIVHYAKSIGSSNPKHLHRFDEICKK